MKKNKLVIAMAATALLSSMGAMAAKQDSFNINYNVVEQVTIDVSRDVNLSDADSADGPNATTNVRGTTTFCVGRQGATGNIPLGYTLAADSNNNGNLLHSNGSELAYILKYQVATDTLPTGDYANATEIDTNGVPDDSGLKTGLDLPTCNNGTERNGIIWVNIADTDGAEDTGEYTDTVTLTVAVQ